MQGRILRQLLLVMSLLTLLIGQASARTIDKIVVFGDSLSDNGNIHHITETAHQVIPLVPVIPNDRVYYGGRFSNGPVWVDNLSKSMNVKLDDYAYGGAWVEPITVSKIAMPINLGMQVNFFLVKAATDFNTSKHLYVIWGGGNDYVNGRSDPEKATTDTVNILREQMDWLRYYGARNFLVMNLPDISLAPQVIAEGSAAVEAARKITLMHNKKLADMIEREQKKHKDDKIILADFTDYMDDVVANPEKYNLKNVTDACYGGGYTMQGINSMDPREIDAAKKANIDVMNNSSIREAYITAKLAASGVQPCANPTEYLFWDHLHPTATAHTIISTLAEGLLYINGITGKDEA